jgi:hypothetical protein
MSLSPPPDAARPTVLTLSNGIKVRTFAPPADFDPLTADDDTLLRNGFPARPAEGPQLDRFTQVLKQLSGRLHYIQPTLQVNADRFHGPRRGLGQAQAGTDTSTSWSGGVVFAPRGQSFSWVQGDWTIPNVAAPTENQWYYSASWIGIDGYGGRDVCQAGIACEAYRTSSGTVARNMFPWLEWAPAAEVQITNFPVDYGDFITAIVCAGPAPDATNAAVYFTNRTTGAYTSLNFTAPAGTFLEGNCAEWIVEAPLVDGQQSAMADYGQVSFTSCQAYLGATRTTVDAGTGTSINMVDSNNTTVSAGTLVGATGVLCQYVGTLP